MEMVIPARRRSLGGFEVGRVLPFAKRRMVGPFVFLDHMGPVDLAPGVPRSTDVRPHPHIGLSTVTYLFEGEITHRDSLGIEQAIRPGEVNWMTAGRGISHSERFDGMRRDGGRVDGIQAWVALPDTREEDPPAFAHHGAADLPMIEDAGIRKRLIAGSAFDAKSPVETASPLFYLDAVLDAGGIATLPAEYPERAAYVARGRVDVDGHDHEAGQMLVFAAGEAPTIRAIEPSRLMLLGGEPLGPRHIWWNFVSSRKERIEQAKADWRTGRIALPPADDRDPISLPEDPKPGS
jgi:redox-sensitive bicupin YhaK (pirin superfamily)